MDRTGTYDINLNLNLNLINTGATSWSTKRSVAQRFSGENGTILEVDLNSVRDRIVPRPDVKKHEDEFEILLKGEINATPTNPYP